MIRLPWWEYLLMLSIRTWKRILRCNEHKAKKLQESFKQSAIKKKPDVKNKCPDNLTQGNLCLCLLFLATLANGIENSKQIEDKTVTRFATALIWRVGSTSVSGKGHVTGGMAVDVAASVGWGSMSVVGVCRENISGVTHLSEAGLTLDLAWFMLEGWHTDSKSHTPKLLSSLKWHMVWIHSRPFYWTWTVNEQVN